MCGVVAFHAYHPAAPPLERASLRAVAAALRNRGPDGEGAWFSADGRVALAHTRLAVIAPGPAAAQPMTDAHGTCVLSYNGELYEHVALRRRLEARGHSFHDGGDTEVLLAMYREYGEGMLERLRGMFAFALWDRDRGELLLGRDGYGIKPMYYADDGSTVRAASQVRALLADPAVSREIDPAARAGFLLLGSVPEPFTSHRAIRALPAGCVMRVGPAGVGLPRRWFSIAATLAAARREAVPANPAATLREALRESVAAHFVADVPVGLFLSSGLDSAVVLALAVEQGFAPRALTLAFDEFRGQAQDEAQGARALAAHYGVAHRVRRVQAAEFHEDLPRLLAAMDQPTIDGVNAWFASKAAAEWGLKVALSGIGGDELLGGYPSFRTVPWLVRLAALPARIPGLGRALAAIAAPGLRAAGLHPKLAGLVALGGRWPDAWFLKRGLFLPWELERVMPREQAREGLERLCLRGLLGDLLRPDPGTAVARITALESGAYLRNQLLRDADWAGMAHGVEVRTPLVDTALLRVLAPWLVRRPAAAGKRVLAEVPARRLPPDLAQRPKTGFTVPLETWLRGRPGDRGAGNRHRAATSREWALAVARTAFS